MKVLSSLDIDTLRAVLEGAFQTVDVEGTGQLTFPQVRMGRCS
jgi:hypothetical protein